MGPWKTESGSFPACSQNRKACGETVGTQLGCKASFLPEALIVFDENHYDVLLPYQTSTLFQIFIKLKFSPAFMNSLFKDEQRENPEHRTVCDSVAWSSIHSSQRCVHSLGASSSYLCLGTWVPQMWPCSWEVSDSEHRTRCCFQHTHPFLSRHWVPF